MSARPEDIVQEVRREFETLIQWVTGTSAAAERSRERTAYEVEFKLFYALLALGRQLLSVFFSFQGMPDRNKTIRGREGQILPSHSERTRSYFTIFGKIQITRSYYYGGTEGQFPADAALNLPRTACSDMLREWMERMVVAIPYPQAARLLGGFLGLTLSTRIMQEQILEDATVVKAFYEQKPLPEAETEGSILVLQADGKGVPILRGIGGEPASAPAKVRLGKGEKVGCKKEAIVTAVYTTSPFVRTPEAVVQSFFKLPAEVGESEEISLEKAPPAKEGVPQNKHLSATLEGKDAAFASVARQMAGRQGPPIQVKLALTDGCEALQTRIRLKYPDLILILDFVHADEYLWKVTNALLGETHPHRTAWVAERAGKMLSGQTDLLIAEFRQEAQEPGHTKHQIQTFLQVADYFERNLDAMRYDQYLVAGWPIATGVIEGACRHIVKDRCELSGMRWSKPGAQALLQWRCVEANGDWDEFHAFRRHQRLRQVYGLSAPSSLDRLEEVVVKTSPNRPVLWAA